MALIRIGAAAGLAVAAAACGQGNSDNMMSPEGNALTPVDVNAVLGPEPATDQPVDTNAATSAAGANAIDSESDVAAETSADVNNNTAVEEQP